jgi:hypothetical protein
MPEPTARPEPTAEALLPALRALFRERGVDRLGTPEIVAALSACLGRPITAHRLARTLGPVGVRPRQFRIAGRPTWGYLASDLPEGRDAAPPVERRDAGVVEPLVPEAVAAPEPGIGIAGQDHLDAEREWSWRVALSAMGC